MKGFDFGQIGGIVSDVMDSDYIDIKRNISGSLVEVYSNIPCHIAYVSIDNPNPDTVDIKPIIQGLTIHVPLWVDIRNDDFIIAKKIGSNGSIEGVYSGRCGNQVVSQGRKKVMVEMSATQPYEPTPVPPTNPIEISISFKYGDEPITPTLKEEVEEGENFVFNAPSVEGYSYSYTLVDSETRVDTSTITIPNVKETHAIEVVYVVQDEEDSFRFLVNGLYTKNDGTLANGWHTYVSVPIDSISENEGVYTITSDNVVFEHRDNGKILSIKTGEKIVLFPNEIFVTIGNVNVSSGKATFVARPFNPTQDQSNFYKTRWYEQ